MEVIECLDIPKVNTYSEVQAPPLVSFITIIVNIKEGIAGGNHNHISVTTTFQCDWKERWKGHLVFVMRVYTTKTVKNVKKKKLDLKKSHQLLATGFCALFDSL